MAKGSTTYPDALAVLGFYFETASSRGHLRDTANGVCLFHNIQKSSNNLNFDFTGSIKPIRALLWPIKKLCPQGHSELSKKDKVKRLSWYTERKRLNQRLQRPFNPPKRPQYSYWPLKQDVEIEGANYRAVAAYLFLHRPRTFN